MARKNNILKEKKKLTWRFYTILSSAIAVVLVGAIVLMICLYNHFNTATYRNRFSDWTEHKINYDELTDILEDENTSNHIFIFLYDETYFDQDEIDDLESDDPSRSTYIKANAALNAFYSEIEKNHDAYELTDGDYMYNHVEFYVINTSLTGNSAILTDEKYGAVAKAPSLLYLYGESYAEKDVDEEYTLSGGKGTYSELTQVLNEAKDFVSKKTPSN